MTIEPLYSDMNGGQCTVTRLAVLPAQENRWVASVSRHWTLDTHTPLRP